MALNIVLGKPKTGKSTYIYENIEKDIKNNKDVILFVPSQRRQETENNYIKYLKKSGIIGVNITTISEYVKENIINLGLYNDEGYVSTNDKKIILADVISSMQNEIKVFKGVSRKDGFLDLMYIYIDLIRKSGFDVKKIDEISIKNNINYLKLKEICNIYAKYIKKLEENFTDNIDEMDIFINNISKIKLENTSIYFDAYNNFTKKELEIVKMFLDMKCDITISITTDITKVEDIYACNTSEIFETSNMTYLNLLQIASSIGIKVHNKLMYIKYLKQKQDIKYLSDNIFSNKIDKKINSQNVHIGMYSNAFSEIEYIASYINKKVRVGYRYKDFDIYTTDLDGYKDIISRVFFQANIPIYINSKENIKFSKLTTYILKYFDILKNGVKKDTLIDILKLGFCDVSEADVYEFENYMLEFNITDYNLTKEFKLNNTRSNEHIYDIQNLNSIRSKLIDIYNTGIKKEESAKWYVAYIWEHLNNSGVLQRYKDSLYKLEKISNEFDISNLDKEKQVWAKLCEIFNSISKVYKEKMTFDVFVQVFKLQIKDTYVKTLPPVLDSVNLLDINLSNGKESKNAFFIGVNEGSFPKISEEDILFNDEQLKELQEKGFELKETTISKQNMAKYNIYNVLNSVTNEINILIPISDYSGKSLRISSIINDIKKILDVKIQSNILSELNETNINSIYSKNEILEYMLELINNVKIEDYTNEKISSIYEYINNDIQYNTLLNYIKNDDNLNKKNLEKIYGDKFDTSISKLELFKKCPFSYYMKYLLKIEPRREFEISSLDVGSFMHEVLEEFSKYLFESNITWQSLLLNEEWNEKLDEVIEKKLNANLGNKKQSIKYEILKEKLINTMKKVVKVIATSFNQSEFVPYGYEIEFKEGKLFAPIKIKISENKTMNIIGKIDRVDVLRANDNMYVRIIDYKSSKKDLKLEDIKDGISLQLITYLDSFIENVNKIEKQKENINKVLPAGMLYFNLSDKLINLKDYINDEEKIKDETIKALRMKGIFLKDLKIIEKMDKKLSTDKRLIDISKTTLTKDNTNRALSEDEYKNLFVQTKNILGEIGKEIISGVVRIRPNKKCDYCKYCNYSSVCRKQSEI